MEVSSVRSRPGPPNPLNLEPRSSQRRVISAMPHFIKLPFTYF